MKKIASLLLTITLLFHAASASACGFLNKSEPKVGSVLKQPPQTVSVWLSMPINPSKSFIEVKNEKGEIVSVASVIPPNTTKEISATLKPLAPGKYKVTWQMTAKDCGHISKGTFPFTVSSN